MRPSTKSSSVLKQRNMHNWLTRTCVASTWPPKAPLDAWRLPPSVPWEEQAEEEVQEEEVVPVSREEEEQEQQGAEVPTPG